MAGNEIKKEKKIKKNKTDPETEIRKIINRHVTDQDDIISDEEFNNLRVGVSEISNLELDEENSNDQDVETTDERGETSNT